MRAKVADVVGGARELQFPHIIHEVVPVPELAGKGDEGIL